MKFFSNLPFVKYKLNENLKGVLTNALQINTRPKNAFSTVNGVSFVPLVILFRT
jgi:hypothetical protein